MSIRYILICIIVFAFACNPVFILNAQESNDTIYVEPVDSAFVLDENDTLALKKAMTAAPSFKPNPKRAVMYSAIFPGLGQIYNQKYWKLPIVYGGIMGFVYAISWNNRMYGDYRNAYMDFYKDKTAAMSDNPEDKPSEDSRWHDFTSDKDYDSYLTNSSFEQSLRRGTDYYRRYRDLSIILAAAWYFVCIADSYVDAQLFDFDITPDLSMRVEPVVTPKTRYSSELYGINCRIKF